MVTLDKMHIDELEAENEKFRAEIERLKDLQSPGHARLERIATAAMQAALTGSRMKDIDADYFRQVQAKNCVTAARALIAELDGEAGE